MDLHCITAAHPRTATRTERTDDQVALRLPWVLRWHGAVNNSQIAHWTYCHTPVEVFISHLWNLNISIPNDMKYRRLQHVLLVVDCFSTYGLSIFAFGTSRGPSNAYMHAYLLMNAIFRNRCNTSKYTICGRWTSCCFPSELSFPRPFSLSPSYAGPYHMPRII